MRFRICSIAVGLKDFNAIIADFHISDEDREAFSVAGVQG